MNEFVISSILEFIDWICDDLDIEAPGISFLDAEDFPTATTMAVFNRLDGNIYYNLNYIPDFPDAEALYYVFFSTAHELRHKYQFKENDNIFNGYVTSNKTDLKSYNQQWVEIDANTYAVKKMDEFNPDWDIYNIKEAIKNESKLI